MTNGSHTQVSVSSTTGPNPSLQMLALEAISAGVVSLFQVAFRSVSNFALEHSECTLAGSPSGTSQQKLTFHLSKAADLATDLYLEVKCPTLESGDGSGSPITCLATYVWGLGYAMISHAQFLVSNHSQEDLNGDYMELYDELHGIPGKRFEEAIFKYDNVTLPELAALSAQGPTLYIPIPFWWTKGTHAALPIISLNCYDMDVVVHLRPINEIYVALTDTMAVQSTAGTSPHLKIGGNASTVALDWSQFQFSMWMGSVFLDTAERNTFANTDHSYVMKTVQSYTSYASDQGHTVNEKSTALNNVSFQHPTSALIWTLADPHRRASKHTQHSNGDGTPYTAGVRSLYGTIASVSTGGNNTVLGRAEGLTDFNVLREGHRRLSYINDAGLAADLSALGSAAAGGEDSSAGLLSSAAVKVWRRDGLNNCLHLPGNRFDYRMAASGKEIEPLDKFMLTFNSNDRVHSSLSGEHYRQVQGQHFNNIPRKGIYAYSFAMNGSSPFPQGSVNLSRVDTINITIDKHADYPVASNDVAGAGVGSELLLYSEHFNIWKVTKNSVGKTFG